MGDIKGRVDPHGTFQTSKQGIRDDLNGGFRVWRRHEGLGSLMAANDAIATLAAVSQPEIHPVRRRFSPRFCRSVLELKGRLYDKLNLKLTSK